MKKLSAIVLLLSTNVYADSCMKEANQFLELVAVKSAVSSNIENSPDQFKEENWQYIHALGKDLFKKGKFTEEAAVTASKLLASNDFSDNPEVEVNIFEDYWLLSCRGKKKNIELNALPDISKDSLLECWNSASSRKEFQKCLTPLIYQS